MTARRPVRPRVASRDVGSTLPRGLTTALFALLLSASPAAAMAQERFRVLEEPTGSAVGLAVVVNAGAAWELEREAGLTLLAALALLEELRPELDRLEAVAAVTCQRAALEFTMAAPRASWEAAARLLLDALRDPSFGDAAFERARHSLLPMLAMQETSPALGARETLHRAFFGENHRWAVMPCGRAETVAGLDGDNAGRLFAARLTPTRMTAAIAGPVDARAARTLLGSLLPTGASPVLLPAPVPAPAARNARTIDNTVTAWVELAFPLQAPRGGSSRGVPALELEALRLIGQHLRELAVPSPANPGVYSVTADLERYGGGGALIVSLIVARDQAARWADVVRNTVRTLQSSPLPELTFESLLRRYRGTRLLELAAPEARALEAARQLFFDGDYRSPARLLEDLTPATVRTAAGRLGAPAVAILAPE